ncbi:autophagy-related protein 2 homolog A [Alligator sinensis]|uniref:Autophagy-related protein 2 homolog A n=1 Tax=Alligator sinensis TaxID=38654 RepID=A0A3Q0HGE0_ALLSI|nr:autophagy-related protein 2 homolog A [Alligator sinensis]
MSRWFFPWSSSIKKRACRYLLQHYLGHYLEERLSLEQLSLDLYQGAGALRDIHLDVWSVNELLESANAPLEIVDGFIESISVAIPWAALVTENCTVEVTGLQVTCRPKDRTGSAGMEAQSWASGMTTSLQLAKECLKEQPEEPPQPLEGLEMFAQTIETVLRRIKVTFVDTIVRVEHAPGSAPAGVALELHIKRLEYCDEALREPGPAPPPDVHQLPAVVRKVLQLRGVRLCYEDLAPPPPLAPPQAGAPASPPSTLLQIGSCSGYTEVTVKVKQNEALPGPKLELDGKLGALHLLLAPEHIAALHSLLAALGTSGAGGPRERPSKSRPLDSEDLKLIEQDLNQQLYAGLGPGRPDGADSFLGSENGEMFFSMAPLTSSVTSTRSVGELSDIDLDSSVHSDYGPGPLQPPAFAPGLILSSPRRFGHSPFAATVPGLGKWQGKPPQPDSLRPKTLVRVTVGGLTLTVPHQGPAPAPPLPAQDFFTELDSCKDAAFGGRDFTPLRQTFERACPHSHLRLTAAAVQLSWEQRAACGLHVASADLGCGKLEVLECLWPDEGSRVPIYTELLSFAAPSEASARPCAQVRYKQTEQLPPKGRGQRRRVGATRSSEVAVDLAPFQAEVDLGALDRLAPLLRLAGAPSPRDTPPHSQGELHMGRAWAQRAVRPESLRLELSDLALRSELHAAPSAPPAPAHIGGSFSDLHGVLEDGAGAEVPCVRLSRALDPAAKGPGKAYLVPKITLTLNPPPGLSPWDLGLDKAEELELSLAESPCELPPSEASPFSSKRTMYETEEMVIPGEPEEMAAFQAATTEASRCALEVTLPSAHIFLPGKAFYERLYNRINNDLLMWELSCPLLRSPGPAGGAAPTPGLFPGVPEVSDRFRMCKSAFKLDSDSEDEDAPFPGAEEGRAGHRSGEGPGPPPQSHCSIVFNILKGRVTALCDAKGEAGQLVAKSHGELVLDVDDCTIFSVSQYKGQEDLGYLCIEAERVNLYHNAVLDDYPLPERLELPSFMPPARLRPTLYPSEEGVPGRPAGGRRDQPAKMLVAAIRIHLDLDKNIKEFLVTVQLEGATMRHYMALPNQSWYTQLIEFLDVVDEPILGYDPPTVITVLHTHLFSCAVDYRPLYLPIRVLITAETFTLSSNIIVDTSIFLLRFILDDSAIYLSDKCEADSVDLRKDYVCVLDVDLLELVITTWKGDTAGKLLSESPASLPSFPPAETAVINQRDLTDALIDTERGLRDLDSQQGKEGLRQASPVSVYLFPGENGRPPAPGPAPGTPLDEGPEPGSPTGSRVEGEAVDADDFCILDAPGLGIPVSGGRGGVSRDGIWEQGGAWGWDLGAVLGEWKRGVGCTGLETRTPGFLGTIVWHLYGGRDFGSGRGPPGHAHSPRMKPGLGSPRGSPSRPTLASRPQNTWRAQGGAGRQHNMLMEIQLTKVSFQHETYPAGAEAGAGGAPEAEEQPAGRQVLLVQELEVRDRLASSQINKFLYLYTSERMPRRAHANMLTVKALHVLPEAGLGGPECCLRVSLMPLRLNIDQDALFFLKDFFTSLAAGIHPVVPMEAGTEARLDAGVRGSPAPEPESLGKEQEGVSRTPGPGGADLTSSMETTYSENSSSSTASSSADQPIYFREFRFTSEVPIWLDYHGKHVTMDQVGTFAGILIGLAQLNCSELKLKRLCCRHGLLGVDKVLSYALTEWLSDIRKNQLPGILGGVGPMHSVVQLVHGLRDLFWLPIEQYRKDGRLMRGLQRGAASFGTSTAAAALELSNRLVQAIQATAETVYDILSPTPPPPRALPARRPTRRQRRGQPPADLREGVAKAYDAFREGVLDTAQTICDVAGRGHAEEGPPPVVRPLIVATEATSNLLGGMRNQIRPDARKEEALKWRLDEPQD